MNRSRMKIIYSGHVQGVGFRYNARSVATGYELSGTVRNLADGRVELIRPKNCRSMAETQCCIRPFG